MQPLVGQKLFAVVAFLAPPFGLSPTTFWVYVSAAGILAVGVITIPREESQLQGFDRFMPLGPLFFAVPMAVFGSEHFTDAADIAQLVPRWLPAHMFWTLAIGAGFILGAISLVTRTQTRLAATLFAITFLIFVATMDAPGVVRLPHNRFAWALAFRELSFGCGAFALALSPFGSRPARPAAITSTTWVLIPRTVIAAASLFYGVEHLLHPDHVPGIPLEQLTPAWIHGRLFVNYLVAAALLIGGICLLVNQRARAAAIVMGLTIFLSVLWVYLPMLIAAPRDIVALNYFFDTLLFSGAILLLANAMERQEPSARAASAQAKKVVRARANAGPIQGV